MKKTLRIAAVAALALALASVAQAGYVASISNASTPSPTLTVLNDQFQVVGIVAVPPGSRQVLISNDGGKLIVIAENAQAPVTFITIQGNVLISPTRTLFLNSATPAAAAFSQDGSRLYVLGKAPGALYTVDLASEQAVGSPVAISGIPLGMQIALDGRYAVVLSSPGILTPVDLNTGAALTPTSITGVLFPDDKIFLTRSPFGTFFVTGFHVMLEFRGEPPFDELARTVLATHPGRLSFSPDGKAALAPDLSLSGSSLLNFNFTLRGPVTPAGSQVSAIPLVAPAGSPFETGVPKLVSKTLITTADTAIAFVPDLAKVFKISYPPLSAADFVAGVFGTPQNLIDAAVSDEFPNSLYLFYLDSVGTLSRFPLRGIGNISSTNVAPGAIHYVASPSTASPGNIYGYGDGLNVAPGGKVRYFFQVFDQQGRATRGQPVTFTSLTAGATAFPASAVTSREGWVSVEVTAPSGAGTFKLQATTGNIAPLVLTSTVAAGGPGGGGGGSEPPPNSPRILKIAGDGQINTQGFSQPLAVRIVDGDGNPIAGKQVLWSFSNTNISPFTPNPTTTDADGRADLRFTYFANFGLGDAFTQLTVDAVTDVGNATFTITTVPADLIGAPSISLKSPEPSNKVINVKLGQPLKDAIRIQVLSGRGAGGSLGVPIPNIGIVVTADNTDPLAGPTARCVEGIPLSASDGISSCTLVAGGRPGATVLTVDIGGNTQFSGITLNVSPGDPGAPAVLSGNNQSGKPGETLPARLVARIADPSGNPLPGTAVIWSVVTPDSATLLNTISTATQDGTVSTQVQLGSTPGAFQVKVTAGDKEAVFQVTVLSTATGLAKISGDGQPTMPIGMQFPQPLIVRVTDQLNNPVTGAAVNWAVAGSATLSALSTPTAADGSAQVMVTAGTVPGNITVSASVTGLAPVTFSLQSRLPGPAITAASFTNYSTGEAAISPGNLVLISGSGIAPAVNGAVLANLLTGRLPLQLANLTVEFRSGGNSYFAPIYWVAKDGNKESALIQVPFDITGPAVDAIVTISGGNTTVSNIPVKPVSPGIIEDMIEGRRAAIIIRSDGLLVAPSTPARRGETVRMYAIGLGQTSPRADTNRVGQPDQNVLATVAVGVDNAGVEVLRVGLAENLIGIYEVVFKIPADATIGPSRPLGLVEATSDPNQPAYGQGSVIAIGEQ